MYPIASFQSQHPGVTGKTGTALTADCARVDDFWSRFTADTGADSDTVRDFVADAGLMGKRWNQKMSELRAAGVPKEEFHLHYDQPALKVC